MIQGNGKSFRSFEVRLSQMVRDEVRRLHNQAIHNGTDEPFRTALRRIGERLRKDPLDFGEPIYRLPILRLLVRHAAILPLSVTYAVHEDRPLVFVRGFKGLP